MTSVPARAAGSNHPRRGRSPPWSKRSPAGFPNSGWLRRAALLPQRSLDAGAVRRPDRMVVGSERTQRNEVVAALDLIKACPGSVTLMLNKIRLTTSYTFGISLFSGTYSPDAACGIRCPGCHATRTVMRSPQHRSRLRFGSEATAVGAETQMAMSVGDLMRGAGCARMRASSRPASSPSVSVSGPPAAPPAGAGPAAARPASIPAPVTCAAISSRRSAEVPVKPPPTNGSTARVDASETYNTDVPITSNNNNRQSPTDHPDHRRSASRRGPARLTASLFISPSVNI